MKKIVVIKIGGKLQDDPRLSAVLADYYRKHDYGVCIVHGGGDKVTTLQRKLGIEPEFRDGKRVTRAEDMPLVQMVLSGSVNKGIVAGLVGEGVATIGLSGEDNGLLGAKVLGDGSLGAVGDIVEVDTDIVRSLIGQQYLLVVSPVSRGLTNGQPLNVNADDAAFVIASKIQTDELLLLSDVDGVEGPDGCIPELQESQCEELIRIGHISKGMVPKVRAAFKGIHSGINHVRIAGIGYLLGQQEGTLIRK